MGAYSTSFFSDFRIWRISSLLAVLRCWMKARKLLTALALDRFSGSRCVLIDCQCSASCKTRAQCSPTSFWAHSLQRELFSTTQWSPRSSHRLYEARRKYSSLLPLGAMPPQHHFVCQCWTWGTWGNSQPMFGGVGPPMTVVITTSEARLWAH